MSESLVFININIGCNKIINKVEISIIKACKKFEADNLLKASNLTIVLLNIYVTIRPRYIWLFLRK